MKVKDFVKKYEKNQDEALKDIIKCTYLPFVKKCELCSRLVKSTHYVSDEDGSNTKFHVDSAARYMLLNLSIVDTYTNIDVDFSKAAEEYDLLAKYNLFYIIKAMLPKVELSELESILEMKEKDVLTNEYEPHAFIAGQVERFGTLLGVSLSPVLDKLVASIENLDDEKLAKLIETLGKVDKKKIIKLVK